MVGNDERNRSQVTQEYSGFTLWFTGLSGAGKSTIAQMIGPEIERRGVLVEHLDGDVVRTNLSKGLGFSREDRDTNILRIGFVAKLLTRHGACVVCAAISPYRETRDMVREMIGDRFVEIFVATSLEECERRDLKGLYAKARSGEIKEFTGISDPYEAPEHPEIVVHTEGRTPEQSAAHVIQQLEQLGFLVPEAEEAVA
jgi:adenylylsulfate kinase